MFRNKLLPTKIVQLLICFTMAVLVTILLSCNSLGNIGSDIDKDNTLSQMPSNQTPMSTTVIYNNAASDPDLTSLDIYPASENEPQALASRSQTLKPIVVYVHGGGFRRGDKSNLGSKADFFNAHEIHFVSVNYRLATPDANGVGYPTFVEDVAQAVAWIFNNAASFGGDSSQIYLMGHSAGGYIVNVLGLENQFLQAVGLSPDDLQGIISLDSGLFDLVEDYEQGGAQAQLIENAFGNDLDLLEAASPINQARTNEGNFPPFFFTYTNQRKGRQTEYLADLIRQTGTLVVIEPSLGRSHSDVNRQLGLPGDPLSSQVLTFMEEAAAQGMDGTQPPSTVSSLQANPTSDSQTTLFSLAYQHDRPLSQATALVDAFGEGSQDLAIAAKRQAYLVQNKGNMQFSEYSALRTDNSNGWGSHDFNSDGLMDLFVAQAERGSKDVLLNQGNGSFIARDLGNETMGNARSVIFADFDGDGYTDSFSSVSSFQTNHAGASMHAGQADGTFGPDIIEDILAPDLSNFWYATANPPSRGQERWSNKQMKGTVTRDFDGDGRPDIVFGAYADRGYQEGGRGNYAWRWVDQQERGLFFLHNLSTPNNFRFQEISKSAFGPDAYGNTQNDWNVYSVIPIDYDLDGDQDLFVGATLRPQGNRQYEDTTAVRFYENQSEPGEIKFVDRTVETGFSTLNQLPPDQRGQRNFAAGQAIDYDNDQWLDLFLVNRTNPNRTNFPFVHVYRNLGNGKFQEVDYQQHGIGNGSGGRDLVGNDLNNDGLVDIVVNDGTVGGYEGADQTRIYQNMASGAGNWIKLNLVKGTNGTPSIGTKVTLYEPGTSKIVGFDEVRTDFCYRSKRSPILHFGLGSLTAVDIKVTTRYEDQYEFSNIRTNQVHRFELGNT
jgi:arylformamidase